VGRLEKIKGHPLLLEALQTLVHESIWSSLDFVWLGTGSLGLPLMGKVKESGLQEHVRMLGHRWDVADWLDASDMFILPSYCEACLLSIIEAMAKGVPVMARQLAGPPRHLAERASCCLRPIVPPRRRFAKWPPHSRPGHAIVGYGLSSEQSARSVRPRCSERSG
jgi:glycosyltransferase involved in cell wall biosynthesis